MRMRRLLKKKINTKCGFTLAETLLAVLIMLMVSAIVVSGIPAAKNAYEKVVLASNAEVLLSTTVSTLRNELGMAQDVAKPAVKEGENAKSDTIITYFSVARQAPSKIYVNQAGEGENAHEDIMLQRYYSEDGFVKNSEAASLVMPETATGGLYITYESVEYNEGTGAVIFKNLSVNKIGGTADLAKRESLSIHVFSDN